MCLFARGRVGGRGERVARLVMMGPHSPAKVSSKEANINQGVLIRQGPHSRPEENVALVGYVPVRDTHNVHRGDPRRFIRESRVLRMSKVELASLTYWS